MAVTATDPFKGLGQSAVTPPTSAFAITPSDSDELVSITRALYVGVAGDVAATMMDGTTVTFTALPKGMYSLRIRKIASTGTAATNMVGLV